MRRTPLHPPVFAPSLVSFFTALLFSVAPLALSAQMDWQLTVAHYPTWRDEAGIAFDSGRGRVVMFGGGSIYPTNDTWECRSRR